jgi:hypothetical protein
MTNVHPSHKMMGPVCQICHLNKTQDAELIEQECIRDESDLAPSPQSRMDQIQDAVAEAMGRIGDEVHKRFAKIFDVGPNMDPQVKAKMLVLKSFNENRDITDSTPLQFEDVYVVSFKYILGNWKALLSTTVSDGKYYEVTHRKDEDEFGDCSTTYIDTYVKLRNEEVTDEELFALYPKEDTSGELPENLKGVKPEDWRG